MKRKSAVAVTMGAALALSASLASAQQVGGAIAQKWWELGSENSVVGRPVSNEIAIPGGGRISCFERGAITWHPAAGAWAMYGDIFQSTGFAEVCRRGNSDNLAEFASVLGYPLGDEYTSGGAPSDRCPRGYRVQLFGGTLPELGYGAVCWNPVNRQITNVGPAHQGF